jgi:hypothetical protein
MQRLRIAAAGALLMLATIGVGAASADPINKNSRYITVDCEGEIIPFVTTSGASGHALDDTRTLVLRAATEDGVWIIPFSKGQSKATTVECVYQQLFDGHQFVVWMSIN